MFGYFRFQIPNVFILRFSFFQLLRFRLGGGALVIRIKWGIRIYIKRGGYQWAFSLISSFFVQLFIVDMQSKTDVVVFILFSFLFPFRSLHFRNSICFAGFSLLYFCFLSMGTSLFCTFFLIQLSESYWNLCRFLIFYCFSRCFTFRPLHTSAKGTASAWVVILIFGRAKSFYAHFSSYNFILSFYSVKLYYSSYYY